MSEAMTDLATTTLAAALHLYRATDGDTTCLMSAESEEAVRAFLAEDGWFQWSEDDLVVTEIPDAEVVEIIDEDDGPESRTAVEWAMSAPGMMIGCNEGY